MKRSFFTDILIWNGGGWTYFWLTEVAKGWEVKGIKQIESPIIDIFWTNNTFQDNI